MMTRCQPGLGVAAVQQHLLVYCMLLLLYFTLQFTLLLGVVNDRLIAAGADVEPPRTPFGCRDSKDFAIVVAMEHWKELPAFVCCV